MADGQNQADKTTKQLSLNLDKMKTSTMGGSKDDSPSKKNNILQRFENLKATMGQDGTQLDGLDMVLNNQKDIDKEIAGLDTKLSEVLRRQEYEYLQAYNIYVKKKEKELRMLITTLQDKNEDKNFKEKRINDLELTIDKLRQDKIDDEKIKLKQKKELKEWKERHKAEVQDKEFYHQQAFEAKRKNKLLKVAIGRMQSDTVESKQEPMMIGENQEEKPKDENLKDNTFLTGANIEDQLDDEVIDNEENQIALVEQNLMNNPAMQKRRGQSQSFQSQRKHKRTQSQGSALTGSRYRQIPTENLKFQQFIDLLFDSNMNKEEMKFEILNYTQALETNYTETIKNLQMRVERIRNQLRKEKSKNVNTVIERGDLENLFVDCVEDVRRNVIKRRLKAEIIGKKKIGKFDENSEEAKEFEESLLKLANLAKDRVKFSEFTSQDRNNLLDLFVNNEKTLLRIYENLFPRRGGQGGAHTNSLKQLSQLKNSSDTIRFAHHDASKFLKGDSIYQSHNQRSLDDTQANTDLQGNSTILPSILPAMNSIQSNDMVSGRLAGRSTHANISSPVTGPLNGNKSHIQMNDLSQILNDQTERKAPHHMKGQSVDFQIGTLNQRSQQFQDSLQSIQP